MAKKHNRPHAGNVTAATGRTATNDGHSVHPEPPAVKPHLTPAVKRALELMRSGTRPALANTRAAGEFHLQVAEVARATGQIAANARLNREARRKAQEHQP